MQKSWITYLASAFLFFGGLFMLLGEDRILGVLFMVLAVAGLIIKISMARRMRNKHEDPSNHTSGG